MTIAEEKKRYRSNASDRRKGLFKNQAGAAAAGHFFSHILPDGDKVISLYWPIGSELDTLPLLNELLEAGFTCVLPVVERADAPLVFKVWKQGDPLEKGAHDIPVPLKTAQQRTPDILVVPMLAFDPAGYRLGYGGGYYDRTLEMLRQERKPLAVGYAYAGQEIPTVPTDKLDQPLDWVVTETEARKIR